MTRHVTKAEWQEERKTFCRGGLRFARKFKTPGAAWRACQNGQFMAWWLLNNINNWTNSHLEDELRAMAVASGVDFVILAPINPKDTALARYARRVRARFNSDGSYRKRSRR